MNAFLWLKDRYNEMVYPFKRPKIHPMLDETWSSNAISKALIQNGIIAERARRRDISEKGLTDKELQRIFSTRKIAKEHGFSQLSINFLEMEGERDKKMIFEPIKVKVRFAFYDSGEYPTNPKASYHILESNHPGLPVHGNVWEEELAKCGIDIPKTPTFEKWVKGGRKCFRGGN